MSTDRPTAKLRSEAIEVRRVEIGKLVDTVPEVRIEGDLTVVPVLEEVLFVEKKLVLKEEIHILRRYETGKVDKSVTLRRQRAVIEKVPAFSQPRTNEDHV